MKKNRNPRIFLKLIEKKQIEYFTFDLGIVIEKLFQTFKNKL
jgi:hypothetical protein